MTPTMPVLRVARVPGGHAVVAPGGQVPAIPLAPLDGEALGRVPFDVILPS